MSTVRKIWVHASYAPDVESQPLRLLIGLGWLAAWVGVFTLPCLVILSAQ